MTEPLTLIPFRRDLVADLDTPVSVYLQLRQAHSFLLESVTGGEHIARYSIIGFDPICRLRSYGDETHVFDADGNHSIVAAPMLAALQDCYARFHVTIPASWPFFPGGAVGFFSWETFGTMEAVFFKQDKPGLKLPSAEFIFPSSLIVFDHAKRMLSVVVFAPEDQAEAADLRLSDIVARIRRPTQHAVMAIPTPIEPFSQATAGMSDTAFFDMVRQGQRHIYEGDVFQMVLSQPFFVESPKDPFDVYRSLRLINPSPYMFFFDMQDYQFSGASPEILVRLQDREAVVRPIAGTRPRILGEEREQELSLRQDEKEVAEHIMLVDLGRNDLGRVCHEVKTSDLMTFEAYSHVIHMVSHVKGRLQDGLTAFDLFRATFPAGTLSGTPKIRAVSLIEKLEPYQRGPYGGALGYIDFRGNMDLCIMIRTTASVAAEHRAVLTAGIPAAACEKGLRLYVVHAGAGIVADSEPDYELRECRAKAKGTLSACLS
jgi:anthranilate synthase component 1